MKRFFSLVIGLLLLSSCSLTNRSFEQRISEKNENQKTIMLEGKISPVNLSLEKDYTHLLLSNNEKTLAMLRSENLALSVFNNKNVIVSGYFEQGEIFNVSSLQEKKEESILTETSKENSYKKYFGFNNQLSFVYKSDFNVSEKPNAIFIEKNKTPFAKFITLNNSNRIKLEEFVNENYSEVSINNNPALRVSKAGSLDYYLEFMEDVLKISIQTEDKSKEMLEDFYDILASIEIIENSEIKSCGGTENLVCETGYRCELQSLNAGVCIKIEKEELNNIDTIVETPVTKSILDEVSAMEGQLYENKYLSYSINYPSSWWFKSFGPQEDSLWRTEFGEKKIENLAEGSIIVTVKNGARGVFLEEDKNIILMMPRDSDSHFEFQGEKSDLAIIKQMAKSLLNQIN